MTYKPFTFNRRKLTMMTLSAVMVISMAAPAAFAAEPGLDTPIDDSMEEIIMQKPDEPSGEELQKLIFSDVSTKNTHHAAIYRAQELSFMNGYPDGTFGPAEPMSRSHAVKALGKYVLAMEGLTIKDISLKDYADIQPFSDVPVNHRDTELVLYSLIVKKAGVFRGSENRLMPANLMSRQQMAQVLVNAFGLKDLPEINSHVIDQSLAFSHFRKYIDILSENGVTAVEKFRPLENTTRAQFASFLTRSYEIANGTNDDSAPLITVDVPAEALSANAAVFTITGTAKPGVKVFAYIDKDNDGVLDSDEVDSGLKARITDQGYSVDVILVQNTDNNFLVVATDTAGNKSTIDVPTIKEDSIAPRIKSGTASHTAEATTLYITFDEELNASSVENINNWTYVDLNGDEDIKSISYDAATSTATVLLTGLIEMPDSITAYPRVVDLASNAINPVADSLVFTDRGYVVN